MIWKIGDGENARIWGERWIQIPNSYIVQSPPNQDYAEAKVSALIDKDLGVWDMNILNTLLRGEEVMAIKSIPLSFTNQMDRLIWRGTINGVFLGQE